MTTRGERKHVSDKRHCERVDEPYNTVTLNPYHGGQTKSHSRLPEPRTRRRIHVPILCLREKSGQILHVSSPSRRVRHARDDRHIDILSAHQWLLLFDSVHWHDRKQRHLATELIYHVLSDIPPSRHTTYYPSDTHYHFLVM